MKIIKYFIALIIQLTPKFWHDGTAITQGRTLFNYKKFWLFSISLRSLISLVPLVILFMFTYMLENKAIKNENYLLTVRLTSNTRLTLTYFLEERRDALKFIVQESEVDKLKDFDTLSHILHNLKMGFGSFLDIGLIDDSGWQVNYSGPFNLKGKNYRNQDWFVKCVEAGSYVSDVFLGYRQLPHMIVALKWPTPNGSFYILRATLDIKKLIEMLSSLELSQKSEAFLCNREGILQTPSKYYGELLKKIDLPIPEYSNYSQVIETVDKMGNHILIGYAYIESSPFILMLVKQSKEIKKGWYSIRQEINWFFAISVVVTMIIAIGISTLMVNKIYDADQTRLNAIERLESSSRLISLGRLAAGVAHEINNPLAVIGENAGLIQDIFNLKTEYSRDKKLGELIEAVLESVERCGEITKHLLEFARHFEPKTTPVQLSKVISEVLSFLRKEALYRNITINIDIPTDLPVIFSDHGSLQQVFLNLINNAFQAMANGGRLDIKAAKHGKDYVSLSVIDNGCGISPEDQKNIFEPFFTTKGKQGGTGLGLSISFGLLKKLKGDISVSSIIGEGTTFLVTLPIYFKGDIQNETPDR